MRNRGLAVRAPTPQELPTENSKGDRQHGDDDEHPAPGGEVALALERAQESGLDPAAGHVAQVPEAAEYGGARAELRLLVPGAVDKVRADAR